MARARRVLNRYRLVERIALGGSAEVWRAHDEQLDRPVAVKRLHPHLLPDEASRRRLAGEARAAASLSHPAIVEIYDIDIEGEAAALVMELVDGESLAARLDREVALPERDAVEIVADVGDALYHAHQRGVIHRDVKPGNILLDEGGKAHLVDFGIARSLAESAERLTLTGTVIGTLRYMAPEQLAGREAGPRTDLYGLGAVLHEALTGEPPYRSGSPVALSKEQQAGPPAMPGVDPALAALVGASLAAEPTGRPLHAGAMANALRDWLDGRPQSAQAVAAAAAAAGAGSVAGRGVVDTQAVTQVRPSVAPAAVGAVPSAAAAATPPARRRSWGLTLPVIAAGVLLALIAFNVVAQGDFPGFGGATPSPTIAPATAVPTPSPTPEWLGELLDRYARRCEADPAPVAAQVVGVDQEQAEDYIRDLIDQCQGGDGDDD